MRAAASPQQGTIALPPKLHDTKEARHHPAQLDPPPEAVLIRHDSILQWIKTYAGAEKDEGDGTSTGAHVEKREKQWWTHIVRPNRDQDGSSG